MITEEFRIYKHCDESCDHCNPETSICELLKMEVIPYQKCILEHKREVPLSIKSDTKRTPANDIQVAKEHHKKHGDMDGDTCLLSECALHYPKSQDKHTKR